MSESNQALVDKSSKFNLFSKNDPVHSFFGFKPLESSEANKIEQLLVDNFQADNIPNEQIDQDINQIKIITSEIKAINKQGTLLIGERIHKAREILKNYKDGTFVKWIDSTFESRRTGYNILSYYDLYLSLPNHVKEDLKKVPQKAAYMLASREGHIDKKAEIISKHQGLKASEFLLLINNQLPSQRKTSTSNYFSFGEIFRYLKNVEAKKTQISDKDKNALQDIIALINHILD